MVGHAGGGAFPDRTGASWAGSVSDSLITEYRMSKDRQPDGETIRLFYSQNCLSRSAGPFQSVECKQIYLSMKDVI